MKKKILQILGITLCMALIFPVHVQAANKKSSEAKVCYTKFIKKKKAAYDNGAFKSKKMFTVMIKWIAPIFLIAILISSILNAFGIITM